MNGLNASSVTISGISKVIFNCKIIFFFLTINTKVDNVGNMKKALKQSYCELYHIKDGVRIAGKNLAMSGNCSGMSGNCTGMWGECSGISGNCTGMFGDCSGISGNCTGVFGECSWVYGNIDDCQLTDEDRKIGVDIEDLIGEIEYEKKH